MYDNFDACNILISNSINKLSWSEIVLEYAYHDRRKCNTQTPPEKYQTAGKKCKYSGRYQFQCVQYLSAALVLLNVKT